MEVQLQKVDPNESGSLDRFDFVGYHVGLVDGPDEDKLEKEISLDSAEEEERSEDEENFQGL